MELKQLVENYAHDYRDMAMSEEVMTEMLWSFWHEAEKETRVSHLKQFMSKIDSHGFFEWATK